jgi:hypothetical protein
VAVASWVAMILDTWLATLQLLADSVGLPDLLQSPDQKSYHVESHLVAAWASKVAGLIAAGSALQLA